MSCYLLAPVFQNQGSFQHEVSDPPFFCISDPNKSLLTALIIKKSLQTGKFPHERPYITHRKRLIFSVVIDSRTSN